MCYCINRNDNTTITYHFIQKQRTTAKELSMGSFKVPVYMHKSVFTPLLFISRINLSENECFWYLYPHNAARNAKKLQAGYLLANGTKSTRFPIHFYTSVCVLISFMMFYDVKPQFVKSRRRG